ncbi:hypothetical protein AB0B15_05295, partial [Streptomyces sp. NPDC045456]|uniref:hypothetical protein n=1 Tax=Streptomyces sp. NPDC045456 TaxID=3155254 RepID=UPI0033E31BE3
MPRSIVPRRASAPGDAPLRGSAARRERHVACRAPPFRACTATVRPHAAHGLLVTKIKSGVGFFRTAFYLPYLAPPV